MPIKCCHLAFSLLFSTHKYILTGDFSCLGLNRITCLLHHYILHLVSLAKVLISGKNNWNYLMLMMEIEGLAERLPTCGLR